MRIAACIILCLCFTMAGCRQKGWQLHDVSGHLPDLRFALTADDGRRVTGADYRGQAVLLYFGFTGCSSQCPLVMGRLAGVLKRMGPRADSIRVLFVTIDPAHDTPEKLRRYLAAFDIMRMKK